MQIIIHRINTIEELQKIPQEYGVEVDVRGYGDTMLLTHDPVEGTKLHAYDSLENYLERFKHAFIVFNIKEAGYESRIIALAEKYGIENYFLLDVEFPFLYRATRADNFRKIAIRYSEAEPIEGVEAQVGPDGPLLEWVWIDTNTKLPLNADIVARLAPFKTCVVSPDRWGRPEDIEPYTAQMQALGFKPDAVMTGFAYRDFWNAYNDRTI
jgi:hypothetical protein